MVQPGDTAAAPAPPLLTSVLAACRGGFFAVVFFSLCINLLMLVAPLYMLQIFDRVLSSRSTDTLLFLTLIAGIALVALALLEAVRNSVMVRLGTWLDQRLSGAVLSGNVVATLRHGRDPSIQSLRDLSTFRTFLTGPAIFPIMDAPWTPIFLAVIFLLHPLLGWLSVAGALVLLALALSNEFATRKLLQDANVAAIRAFGQAESTVRNADVVEAMGMLPNLVRRWHRHNVDTLALQAQASGRSGRITAFAKFVRQFLQVGVLGVGAWLVLRDELTPGAMIAASILMSRALAPVDMAINAWKSAVTARGAYGRIRRQLDEAPPPGRPMKLPAPQGALQVSGLAYIHPSASEPALRGITFGLDPGETLGIIGPTAAGKSTLARILVGNLQPRTGDARLDGVDVAQWHPEDLGRHIGYLPQDVELFNGTVRENIARMGESDPEEVVKAARLAGVHDMILHLPQGYDTEIGDRGAVLSGGQRQRIALARAVYGKPSFIVLDEPSASLDNSGEEALLNTIAALKDGGATLVVIAHRPNILRHVDKILVLRNGLIDKFGPRDDIIRQVTGPAPSQSPPVHTERDHG